VLLGIAIGWWLWPVQLAGTSPANLRRDFRDDYIVMVATAYEADGDLQAALDRLARVDATNPARSAVALMDRLTEAGGNAEDIARLERLTAALGGPPDTRGPSAQRQ
jgi:hypothetical protein